MTRRTHPLYPTLCHACGEINCNYGDVNNGDGGDDGNDDGSDDNLVNRRIYFRLFKIRF